MEFFLFGSVTLGGETGLLALTPCPCVWAARLLLRPWTPDPRLPREWAFTSRSLAHHVAHTPLMLGCGIQSPGWPATVRAPEHILAQDPWPLVQSLFLNVECFISHGCFPMILIIQICLDFHTECLYTRQGPHPLRGSSAGPLSPCSRLSYGTVNTQKHVLQETWS